MVGQRAEGVCETRGPLFLGVRQHGVACFSCEAAPTSRSNSSWRCNASFSAFKVEARFHSASSFPRSSAAATTAALAASFEAATAASAADARRWRRERGEGRVEGKLSG